MAGGTGGDPVMQIPGVRSISEIFSPVPTGAAEVVAVDPPYVLAFVPATERWFLFITDRDYQPGDTLTSAYLEDGQSAGS